MTGLEGGDWYRSGEPIDEKPWRKPSNSDIWHSDRSCPGDPKEGYTSSWRPVGGKRCKKCKARKKKV